MVKALTSFKPLFQRKEQLSIQVSTERNLGQYVSGSSLVQGQTNKAKMSPTE